MDEQTTVKRVLAEYEKLVQSSPRIRALEKKLADGTITMKEGAELNDLRARAFGKALSGSVTGIERGSREGACVSLLKDRCADVDELALAAQKTALTRQGLNLTPPTAPFEEERARKIGHSLEDDTVPDETIQRRARSATETMLRSQYDRDMERGAKTCSDAGLRTYIVRDADPGCCKWCSEAAGRYTYGEEPKDVYRRHDNCSCVVVYESSRGRQNVWSKQNWSREQEKEYLRLRDEMAPKRLNARQAQALREQAKSEFERSKIKTDMLDTIVDASMLNSPAYRRLFNALGENTAIERITFDRVRAMLTHRTGTEYEDLSFIDSLSGKQLTRTDYNVPEQVEPTKAMKKMVRSAEPNTIIGIHNHPHSYVPSVEDLGAAYGRKYKFGLVACHNGTLYKYKVDKEFNAIYADMLLDKLSRGIYNKDDNEIADAQRQLRQIGVEMEVYLYG